MHWSAVTVNIPQLGGSADRFNASGKCSARLHFVTGRFGGLFSRQERLCTLLPRVGAYREALSSGVSVVEMGFFNSANAASFFKHILGGVVGWLGLAQGLQWLWTTLSIETPELVWAYTVATGFFALYSLAVVCSLHSTTLKAEITRCAEAKSKLESALLRKRQSSRQAARTGKGGRA